MFNKMFPEKKTVRVTLLETALEFAGSQAREQGVTLSEYLEGLVTAAWQELQEKKPENNTPPLKNRNYFFS